MVQLAIIAVLVYFLLIWYKAYYNQTKQKRIDHMAEASAESDKSKLVAMERDSDIKQT